MRAMNKYEYTLKRFQRTVRRKFRRNTRGKSLNLMWVFLVTAIAAAVILVLALSVTKLYSGSRKPGAGENPVTEVSPESEGNVQAAVESGTQEASAPVATPQQRPKAVALTFDDGPSRANDGTILNALQKYGAHATFFVVGDRARVDGDILRMYLAAGCEIGSHSWNHPNLSKMKWKKVDRQLTKTNNMVSKLANGYQISLLRPPYGEISNKMRKKLDMPMILWSLDTEDWKSRNARKIFKKVKKNVKDGDIILMHDIYGTTADAIEKVVPWLQGQGYDILTVTELMARKGKTIVNGKAYTDGR